MVFVNVGRGLGCTSVFKLALIFYGPIVHYYYLAFVASHSSTTTILIINFEVPLQLVYSPLLKKGHKEHEGCIKNTT